MATFLWYRILRIKTKKAATLPLILDINNLHAVFLTEFLNTTSRIYDFLLACIERVAL